MIASRIFFYFFIFWVCIAEVGNWVLVFFLVLFINDCSFYVFID